MLKKKTKPFKERKKPKIYGLEEEPDGQFEEVKLPRKAFGKDEEMKDANR